MHAGGKWRWWFREENWCWWGVEVGDDDEDGGGLLERRRLGISSALDLEVNATAEPAVEQRGAQCCRVDPVALAGDSYAHKHPQWYRRHPCLHRMCHGHPLTAHWCKHRRFEHEPGWEKRWVKPRKEEWEKPLRERERDGGGYDMHGSYACVRHKQWVVGDVHGLLRVES